MSKIMNSSYTHDVMMAHHHHADHKMSGPAYHDMSDQLTPDTPHSYSTQLSSEEHPSMAMYFHASSEATILFKGWQTHNWQGMLGSCVVFFLLAIMYEGVRVGRAILVQRFAPVTLINEVLIDRCSPAATSSDAMVPKRPKILTIRRRLFSLSHLIQTLLHVLQLVLSYVLMLTFMTYNVFLGAAILLGSGIGYFVFNWSRATAVDVNDHCT